MTLKTQLLLIVNNLHYQFTCSSSVVKNRRLFYDGAQVFLKFFFNLPWPVPFQSSDEVPMTFLSRIAAACFFLPLPLSANLVPNYSGQETKYDYSEHMEIDVPDDEVRDKWKLATRSVADDGIATFEWIPHLQKLDSHNEALTVQFMAKRLKDAKPSTAKQLATNMYRQARMKYAEMQWKVLRDGEDDYLYEWILPRGAEGIPPQHEIVRIVSTDKGFHRIAYERRVPTMDPVTRKVWIDRLEASPLFQN